MHPEVEARGSDDANAIDGRIEVDAVAHRRRVGEVDDREAVSRELARRADIGDPAQLRIDATLLQMVEGRQ